MQSITKEKDNHSERRSKILDIVSDLSQASVSDLAKLLAVSVVTIRADLAALEEEGFLLRGHGGAVPAFHPAILKRIRNARDAKLVIAKAAAAHIQDGDTVMIAAGTTTALIPRFLRGKRQVHIVTNNTLLLPYIRTNPQLLVTLVGGSFRASDESLIGPLTIKNVERFRVQRAFLGVDGADPRQGIFANSVESADFVREMATHANEIIVLADAAKFQNPGFVHILPFEEIDLLITDASLPQHIAAELDARKVKRETVRSTTP